MIPRAFLFTPADRPDLFSKAIHGQADAICIDLEDGVIASGKKQARQNLKSMIMHAKNINRPVFIRINKFENTLEFKRDLSAIDASPNGIVLPKVSSWQQALQVDNILSNAGLTDPNLSIISMIEHPMGLLSAESAIGNKGRITGFLFGSEDFATACECNPNAAVIKQAFLRMLLASKMQGIKAYGMPCGIGEYRNLSSFGMAAKFSKENGGYGAFAIHPNQISILKETFYPTDQDIIWANNVVNVFEKSLVDGKSIAILNQEMVDLPIYNRAKNLLNSMNPPHFRKVKEC